MRGRKWLPGPLSGFLMDVREAEAVDEWRWETSYEPCREAAL